MQNRQVPSITGELFELRALLDQLRNEVAVALHAIGVDTFRKVAQEPRDDPNRVGGNLRCT